MQSDLAPDRFGQQPGGESPAEIRRPVPAAGDHALDRAEHAVVQFAVTEMVEHERGGPDGAHWIRDPLAGDVRGRAVNWLEHGWEAALGVDVRAGRDAEAA